MATNSHSLSLNGSGYASASDSASLSITGDMTIECWLNMNALSTTHKVVSKWTPTGNQRSYGLAIDSSGNIVFEVSSGGDAGSATTGTSSGTTLSTGTWTHVAAVYDASAGEVQYYINATNFDSDTGLATSVFDSTSDLYIGAEAASPNLDALVDEVRIWNDIRTGAEISGNYLRQLNGDESGLVAYYKFNNDYLDETSNNNDLSAGGSGNTFSTTVPFIGFTPHVMSY